MGARLRHVARNWQLKLAALALAILLWVVVSAEQVTSQWVNLPVEIASARAARGEVPSPRYVQVRFSGPGREIWELALARPALVVRVLEDSVQRVPLEPRMVRLPPGLAVTPVEVRPAVLSIRVPVPRRTTARVPAVPAP